MELREMKHNKYLEEISNLIWDYIATELYEISKKILPENEIEFLADVSQYQFDSKVIYDYFFIIDKFCNTRVFPQKYKINYSTKFNRDELDAEESANLDLIITTLKSNEKKNFEVLNKFYPRSSGKYITRPLGIGGHRFNVDYSGSIWGLKHFHLKEQNRTDRLLYYTTVESNIYLVAIGNHDDMYKKDILEILVNEFQDILRNLGVGTYLDLPFDNFDNLSKDQIQCKWKNGENIGYFINDRFFVSSNLMLSSRVKANLNYEIANISYQINKQVSDFVKSILKESNGRNKLKIRLDEYKDLSKKELLIKEENQKQAKFIYINYLKNMNLAKELVYTYCK